MEYLGRGEGKLSRDSFLPLFPMMIDLLWFYYRHWKNYPPSIRQIKPIPQPWLRGPRISRKTDIRIFCPVSFISPFIIVPFPQFNHLISFYPLVVIPNPGSWLWQISLYCIWLQKNIHSFIHSSITYKHPLFTALVPDLQKPSDQTLLTSLSFVL